MGGGGKGERLGYKGMVGEGSGRGGIGKTMEIKEKLVYEGKG